MLQTTAPPIATLSLNLPIDLKLHVTPDQFAAIAAYNQELRLERKATGELTVNPPTGCGTGRRNSSINAQLHHWNESRDIPGEVFDSSTGFTLPDGSVLSPDASWIAPERWETLTEDEQEGFAPICPDFVVELRSKSDALKPTQAKMQTYRDNGAHLGWLIDPQNQTVEIYRANSETETLTNPPQISGEDILPGFTLKLSRIWR